MRSGLADRGLALPILLLAFLFALQFVIPTYHHLFLARVMVLATFAIGYNILFGYTGLLSLGHAMFFAAGLYGASLTASLAGWGAPAAFLAGVLAGLALSLIVGLLALRTRGVAFMIVTLMFAQTGYLLTLYFGRFTRGDEGFAIPEASRHVAILGNVLDLADAAVRYNLALLLLALGMAVALAVARTPFGRVFVAIRENEERTTMLGYDTFRAKLAAVVLSGVLAAMAGAAYALLFAYAGATFASVQYSIYPLLWTLLGGAGTVVGPFLGTLLMSYLVDFSSEYISAYLLLVGVALVLLVMFLPKGIAGSLRRRWPAWIA
jgi:branched-chain amino acid transport system permease protein